ncbi:uncharacterized protein LOC135822452 isoform X2 [Sycon ciliatum]|uniref:uncharacterized protein LOC135822452 isoform X2 n=1 Tax=Sycon ciliatum TaxID=27933 RepID=UPI0020ACD3E0
MHDAQLEPLVTALNLIGMRQQTDVSPPEIPISNDVQGSDRSSRSKRQVQPCATVAPATEIREEHHHWYRGKKVGSMSMVKPAAHLVGVVKYFNNSRGEPGSKLTWSRTSRKSYIRDVGLDSTNRTIVIRQSGMYYVFAQVTFDDPSLLYDALKLAVDGHDKVQSQVPNNLVWSKEQGTSKVRHTLDRAGIRFSPVRADRKPNPVIQKDQELEFRKTVTVQALLHLEKASRVEVNLGCSRPSRDENGQSVECKPVLYKQGGRSGDVNYFSLFMI